MVASPSVQPGTSCGGNAPEPPKVWLSATQQQASPASESLCFVAIHTTLALSCGTRVQSA